MMACMRTVCTAALLVCIALVRPLALSAQTGVNGLQQALQGKQLELRSYSADAVAQYRWADGGLATGPVLLHGLEAFLDDTVQMKRGKIVFQGNRVTLVRHGTDVIAMGRSPMKLVVDLQGADPAAVVPQLQMALFFPDLDTAIAGLPNMVARILPGPIEGDPMSACKCNPVFKDGTWSELTPQSGKYTPPQIISTADPEYSAEAHYAKISGEVELISYVSEKGRVDDVWLVRSPGYGLDESAGRAARQYQFKPTKLDGSPVGTVVIVNINFSIF